MRRPAPLQPPPRRCVGAPDAIQASASQNDDIIKLIQISNRRFCQAARRHRDISNFRLGAFFCSRQLRDEWAVGEERHIE